MVGPDAAAGGQWAAGLGAVGGGGGGVEVLSPAAGEGPQTWVQIDLRSFLFLNRLKIITSMRSY